MQNAPVKLKLRSPWEEVKEKMKENDHTLTDDDLAYSAGHEEELIDRLEKVMGKPRDQIIAYIESISANSDLAG